MSVPVAPPAETPATSRQPAYRRVFGGSYSLAAQGEPALWVCAAGLVVCLTMIVGLLALVLLQGSFTFWPLPLTELETRDGKRHLGEFTREETFTMGFAALATLEETEREAAERLLCPALRRYLQRLVENDRLEPAMQEAAKQAAGLLERALLEIPAVASATPAEQRRMRAELQSLWRERRSEYRRRLLDRLRESLERSDDALLELLRGIEAKYQSWLGQSDPSQVMASLRDDDATAFAVWSRPVLQLLAVDVRIPVRRRLLRIGNYELTNEHFRWIADYQIVPGSEHHPQWAAIFERIAWGRFYGIPKELWVGDERVAVGPQQTWLAFERHHPAVRKRWREIRHIEKHVIGEINRKMEAARLSLRRLELDLQRRLGRTDVRETPQFRHAQAEFDETEKRLNEAFRQAQQNIERLRAENAGFRLVVTTAEGDDHSLQLADIVRAYTANRLTRREKFSVYLSRWWEFLSEEPREANSEGGVFPAIWGTVAMTLLMSVVVVPFGVLAALYLREYARSGPAISILRIAINNLAGVPSIVFGVFGLGFFCYTVGGGVDALFFPERLPAPTFGTGGLLWASLTLALLTLPVVIVATEEALAAVPRSMREGSLACGATQWQTIRNIVLPRAMPGIMTGMILAMARGAGEVAPLMLVGAVKLAPELPIDGVFPYVHLERSFMHLGFHIYDLGFQSPNSEAAKPMVFTTTLLLIVLIGVMNFFAMWLRSRLTRRFAHGQF
ncbi:MAG: phosphate ABC transporter permease PstA [Planctomycetota bacterium]|nr:MAG: phosphate ABC transporter permease PstA [Planctomycetota bacterium]